MSYLSEERKLLRDNKSGSSEILINILNYNIQYVEDNKSDKNSLKHLILFNEKAKAVYSGMALVVSGLSKISEILLSGSENNLSSADFLGKLRQLAKNISNIDISVVRNCGGLFASQTDHYKIATYSNSGLVKKVIRHYRSKISEVYLSESRPANEGREMAQYLS